MWPDGVSNPGLLAFEPKVLLTQLCGPALKHYGQNIISWLIETTVPAERMQVILQSMSRLSSSYKKQHHMSHYSQIF